MQQIPWTIESSVLGSDKNMLTVASNALCGIWTNTDGALLQFLWYFLSFMAITAYATDILSSVIFLFLFL